MRRKIDVHDPFFSLMMEKIVRRKMDALVDPFVSLIVEKLGDELLGEAILCTGLRDEVLRIQQELHLMHYSLKDAEAKKQGDERVKKWVQDVRSLAYEIEDVIDTFLLRIEPRRRPGLIVSLASIVSSFMASCEMGWKFIFIKHKIREISERSTNYDLQRIHPGEGTSNIASRSIQEWKLPSPNVHEEPDFVGFHEEFEALVAQLTDKRGTRRCVVSLVGTGGLGKTTLARKVYNSERVQKYFHLQAWISVTQEFALRDILQVIIKRWSVLPDTLMEKMSDALLTHFIAKHLNGKRYLVVLDDIWRREAWDALRDTFPDSNNGSRVMLTTRNIDVASYADARSPPYELRVLDEEESWSLFCKLTFFGKDGICPRHLENLGREIVGKCEGLPLAIIAIGGLLLTKEHSSEWAYVLRNIRGHLVEETSNILSLSYQDLPNLLKPCFVYMVNFPKDHEFRAKELIQMWAAEGLIQQRPGLTVEEFGKACLIELIQRSMVQVAKRSSRWSIKSVYIQKTFWDLSVSEAEEYGFLEVHSGNANAPSTARRLAIHHNDLSEYISLSLSTPFLRSVFIYTQGRNLLQREQEKFLYRGFKLLRVLCLNGAYTKELPKAIGELFHLRYLACKGTSLETLPSSIGNLPHLQTLFVSSFHGIKVPGTILEMQELRHLQVEDAVKSTYLVWGESWRVIEGHPELDSESNLQTLTCVEAGEWMGCLGKLINLRKLGIRLHRAYDQVVLNESIPNMNCLQSLSVVTRCSFRLSVPPLLQIPNLRKFRLEGILETLPESTEFPITLTKLTLAFSYLEEDPLPTLAKLENLRVLRLLGASYTGTEMACAADGFRQLESLHLEELDKLEEWSIAKGAMPILSHLRIDNCRRLDMLPEGLQHVTTLKIVELWNMSDEFKDWLQEDRVGWQRIGHVRSIDIR